MSTPLSFSLRLPPSWSDVELDPRVRDRRIRELMSVRLDERPELRRYKASFTAYIRSVAADAWNAGARYCGVFVEVGSDGYVPGAVTVSVLPPPPPGEGTAADRLLRELTAARRDEGAESRVQTTLTTLQHVGRVPRLYGVQRIAASARMKPIPVVLMHTFVPLGEDVVLIACASPAVAVADELLDLFDAVSDTFQLRDGQAEVT